MAMDWIRNPRAQKVARIVGMILFGVVAFVISIGYTLPEDRLKSFIESRASEAGLALSIGELDAGGFGAFTLSGVKLDFPPAVTTAPDGTRTEKPRSLELAEIKLKINLLSTLFGSPSVRVVANQGGGSLGPVDVKVDGSTIAIELKEIKDFPLPGGLPLGPLALSGIIRSGTGRFLWNMETGLSGSEGAIEIAGDNMVVREPVLNSRQAGPIALTDISLGKIEASVIIDKRSNISALKQGRRGASGADSRVIYFDKLKLDGRDISAMIEGNSIVRLLGGRAMSKSQMTVELAFAINDAFFEKSMKGSDDKPNKFLKTLLDMDPRWRSARSGRFYGLICTGTISEPNCIPRKPTVRAGEFKAPGKEASDEVVEEQPPARKPASRKKRVPTPKPAPVQEEPALDEGSADQVVPQEQAPADEPGEAGPTGNEGEGEGAVSEVHLDRSSARVNSNKRMIRPMGAASGDRQVGGRLVDEGARGPRNLGRSRPSDNIRMQEPGEPTEE